MTAGAARAVRPADVPRLWELVLELAAYERLGHLVTGSPGQLGEALFGTPRRLVGLIAEHDGETVGYALFYETFSSFRTRPKLWLEDLYVRPAARGHRLGRLLFAEFARIALERGCYRVDWHVLDWNEPAIGFYRSLGAGHAAADWLQYGMDETALRTLTRGGG
jgi:GNAT superfamily N-acetyltransferase